VRPNAKPSKSEEIQRRRWMRRSDHRDIGINAETYVNRLDGILSKLLKEK
jgi:hypothetical protein